MIRALDLRMLMEASLAFAKNPDAPRYRWLTQDETAKKMRRILSGSSTIRPQINSAQTDTNPELFEWIRRNQLKYGFMYQLMKINPTILAKGGNLNLAAYDSNPMDTAHILGLAGVTDESGQPVAQADGSIGVATKPKLWVQGSKDGHEPSNAKSDQPVPSADQAKPGEGEEDWEKRARNGELDETTVKPEPTPAPVPTPPTPSSRPPVAGPTVTQRGAATVTRVTSSAPVQGAVSRVSILGRQAITRAPGFARGFAAGLPGVNAGGGAGSALGGLARTLANFIPGGGVAKVVVADFFWRNKKWIIGIVLGILFSVLLYPTVASTQPYFVFKDDGTLASIGIQPAGTATSSATLRSDIKACQFYRGPQGAAVFKSDKLLSYIQEASAKSGIPPALLAAIVRVESPSSVNLTDETVNTFGCPESPTGALGIMQIQPAGTTGHSQVAVEQGAKYLGKPYEQLTRDDYCDPRSNIIMASGFINKKMQYAFGGDGSTWNPAWTSDRAAIDAVANSYYGCLEYGGGDPRKCSGPYNYGQDLWNSLQSCQETIANNTSTNASIVPVGQGGARVANVASQIADQLVYSTKWGDRQPPCDPGGTYGPSFHCWSEMAIYDQAGDPNYVQCTEYVWAAFDKAGYGPQIDMIRKSNAYDWPENAAKAPGTWQVFDDASQLQPGDIISMGVGGIQSHVAVVLNREGDRVKIGQASVNVPTEVWTINNGKIVIPNVTSGARCTAEARSGCRVKFIRMIGS